MRRTRTTPSARLVILVGMLLSACPSRQPPAPTVSAVDAGESRDVRARGTRRRRRSRVRLALNGARAQPGAAAPADPAEGVDEDDTPERPRTNPESRPPLPTDLGPPPSSSFDMTQMNNGPLGLEPDEITRGMNPLMSRFVACAEWGAQADGAAPRGHVSVRMRVRNDGRPSAARVSGGGGGAEFTLCVRRVVAAAHFARFEGPEVFANWGFDIDG
jgi:hypothetical protein